MATDKKSRAKKGRRLTLPLFSLAHNPYMEVELLGELRKEEMSLSAADGPKAVDLVTVLNLESGEEGNLLLPTLVASAIRNLGEVVEGKRLIIERGAKVPGKRYYAYEVFEAE